MASKTESLASLIVRAIYWRLWIAAYKLNSPFHIHSKIYQKSIEKHFCGHGIDINDYYKAKGDAEYYKGRCEYMMSIIEASK